MQDYHKLVVWQNAFKLSLNIYEEIKDSKEYRLKDQLFGAVTSIGANLAEMSGLDNMNSQKQKVVICIGESKEAEYWIEFCREARILSREKAGAYIKEITDIRMKLCALLNAMNKNKVPEIA